MTDPSPPLLYQHRSLGDTIEHFIGDFSRAQLLQTLILSLAWFFDAQQTFITVFTDHAEPEWSSCTNKPTCSYTSIVSEWSLSSPVMRGLPTSAFFSGCLVGGFVLGSLADSCLGRKNMLALSGSLMSLAGLLTAFATNVWVYTGLRFVSGFGRSAIGTCALVLASELVGKKWRGNVGIVGFFMFALGFLSLPGVAFLLKGSSWRLMYLWTSIPSIIYSISVYFVVRESPRWLFIKGRRLEYIETLKSLASPEKWNVGDRYNPKIETLFANCANWEENQQELDMYSALKILLKKSWALWRLAAVMVVAFGLGMIYYGMPLSLGNLPFNLYASVTLNALSEFPASLITFFLIGKLDRKGSVLGLGLLSGISSVTCVLVTNKAMQVSMELVSFFCACTAEDVLFIYALELFPTCVRNSALSMVRQAVVVSGVVSPVLVAAGRRNAWLSYGVFGAAVLVCGLFVVCLPETRGRTLCDTMEEEEGKCEERQIG